MKVIYSYLRLIGLGALAMLAAAVSVGDAWQFHTAIHGSFKMTGYSAKWIDQPYTNVRLAMLPSREYWTTNSVGSELWLVREVNVAAFSFGRPSSAFISLAPDSR